MPRRRIAIVGGGLSGLTAAYELSRTEALRARYEVTVYTPGHRLGGKLASSRNAQASMRNEEQGLHVWFGFYENAFRLARELDARWCRPASCPFESFDEVVSPQTSTPFGVRDETGVRPWPLHWGRNPGRPGDGVLEAASLTTLQGVLHLAWSALRSLAEASDVPVPDLPEAVRRWLEPAADARRDPKPTRLPRLSPGRAAACHRVLVRLHRIVQRTLDRLGDSTAMRVQLKCPVDLLLTVMRGLTNPEYGLFEDLDLDRLDHLELRQWLRDNGAAPETLDWDGLRFAYDACFQYLDGDRTRPDFAAGTALRILLRLMGYKSAPLFLFNAGMGEAFVGPLFEVLEQQGVRFAFFHRLEDMRLSADASQLDELCFARQATVRRGAYRPIVLHGGLPCWPSEPDYAQLVEGDALRQVDLESIWSTNPFERRVSLRRGDDFDDVVLAVPLGVIAGRGGKAPCAELVAQHPRLRACTEQINLAPTIAAQIWTDVRLDAFDERIAMPSWAPPYDVLADMTPVVDHEAWERPPNGCYYLCGVYHDAPLETAQDGALHKAEAFAAATRHLGAQLRRHGDTLWTSGALEAARWRGQFVRANVEPTDLCDGGNTGTAHLRLEADQSGIDNLALAGTYLRTGINSTCVEAAVMAGMAAARAVHGELREIIGEAFLARPFEAKGLPVDRLEQASIPASPLREAS